MAASTGLIASRRRHGRVDLAAAANRGGRRRSGHDGIDASLVSSRPCKRVVRAASVASAHHFASGDASPSRRPSRWTVACDDTARHDRVAVHARIVSPTGSMLFTAGAGEHRARRRGCGMRGADAATGFRRCRESLVARGFAASDAGHRAVPRARCARLHRARRGVVDAVGGKSPPRAGDHDEGHRQAAAIGVCRACASAMTSLGTSMRMRASREHQRDVEHRVFTVSIFVNFFLNITDQTNYDSP